MSKVADASTATPQGVIAMPRSGRRIRLARLRDFALIPAIGVFFLIGLFVDQAFASSDNLLNVLQNQTELGLLVLAEVLILIAGKFDLSLESTVALAPALGLIVTAWLGIDLIWAIPVCIASGILIGLINGLLIVKLRLSAFVLTLGMLITLRGLVIALTGGASLFEIPSSFSYLGATSWAGLPTSVWIFGIAFLCGIVALGYLRHGRSLYAVGGNVDAAKAAGIRTDRVLLAVFILGSVLAAIAGILLTGRLGSVAASQAEGWIFQVMAAAVIGGVSLDGGKGTVFGALCGVLMLGLIQNILTLAGVPPEWFMAIYGAIIILAVMLSRLTSGKAQD